MAGRTRRRVTTALTLVVLVVVLGLMGYYGVQQALKPFPAGKGAKKAPSCSEQEKQVKQFLARSDVQVSVYNAGSRSGLASVTLEKLENAGFIGGNSGNAPGSAEVRRAVVWTTKRNDDAARLVAQSLGASTQVQVTTTDLGPGVDVLVGNRFRALDRAAPRRIKLVQPIETCVQVD